MRHLPKSEAAFAAALARMPGGVSSPVRANKAVGGVPTFIADAKGPYLFDIDGNRYIDYIGGYGPHLLGHRFEPVEAAVREALGRGWSYGEPSEAETALCAAISDAVPSAEVVRLVSSGTEACMAAIRVARGFTGRDIVVKFDGCYHGHADGLLVAAGSGGLTFGTPDSAGVPSGVAALTRSLPYNDPGALAALFASIPGQIACVIVEPVVGNMGVVPPTADFLSSLRKLTASDGALLVFDEVMTGFRLAAGCAQARLGVTPDLTTFGKVVGGGMPLAAYGGRAEIMRRIAPEGPVYQAGTLSGNGPSVAAGRAALRHLQDHPETYVRLEALGARLQAGLEAAAAEAGVAARCQRVGSMWTMFFCGAPVTDLPSAMRCDHAKFASFYHGLRDRGVLLPPSQFEACFLSAAHTGADIDATIAAAREALRDAR